MLYVSVFVTAALLSISLSMVLLGWIVPGSVLPYQAVLVGSLTIISSLITMFLAGEQN